MATISIAMMIPEMIRLVFLLLKFIKHLTFLYSAVSHRHFNALCFVCSISHLTIESTRKDNLMPVFFILVIMLCVFIALEKSKSDRLTTKKSEEFWNNEQLANEARRQDISSLEFIPVPFDVIPDLSQDPDEVLRDLYLQLQSLADKKIVNLSGLTNTELKLKYGVANLDALISYDHNYMVLIRTLSRLAQTLFDSDRKNEAREIALASVRLGSDIRAVYILLAKLYAESNEIAKIDDLIDRVTKWSSLTKDSLLESLNEIRSHCNLFSYEYQEKL